MTLPQQALVSPAIVDGVDVAAVAAIVQACPGVSALAGEQFGDAVSYLPGRKVEGVAVGDGRVRVQVRARWGVRAADLATLIAVALAPLAGHRPVDVAIADIDDPPDAPGARPGAGPPPPPPPVAAGLPPV